MDSFKFVKLSSLVKDFLLTQWNFQLSLYTKLHEELLLYYEDSTEDITRRIYFLRIYHASQTNQVHYQITRETLPIPLLPQKEYPKKKYRPWQFPKLFIASSDRSAPMSPCACECKSTRVSRLCPIVDRRSGGEAAGSKCVSAAPSNYYPSCKRATRTGYRGHRGK